MLAGLGLLVASCVPGTGQVLARPGWAGSGVAPEAWWHRAVFYRVDPARFQDSNGDGTGDLQGVAERLDYLQSLGVDALVLDGSFDSVNLEDLTREASRHHLRVIVGVDGELARGPRDALERTVHGWLGAGAAGAWLPRPAPTSAKSGDYASQAASVADVVKRFPGERIVLSEPAPEPLSFAPRPLRLSGRARAPSAARVGRLTVAAAFPVASAGVSELRSSLVAAGSQETMPGMEPLLRFAADPGTGAPNALAAAAVLLASRGAALVDFGTEIGLDAFAPPASTQAHLPVMQWTPSNHTSAAAGPPDQGTGSAAPADTEFGAFHPYQPPPHGLPEVRASPHVSVDANLPAALPDPDTLPGFTSGPLPVPPFDGARINVVTEDRDPHSLLNAYRQLLSLHHDNATLRNGTQYVMNHDAEGALVWVRRAPAGSRTVANVVVAANLTDRAVTLVLTGDLQRLGMRPGALRVLFSSPNSLVTGQSTDGLALPPHGVFLGEVFHAGAGPEPGGHEERGRRRARRRR